MTDFAEHLLKYLGTQQTRAVGMDLVGRETRGTVSNAGLSFLILLPVSYKPSDAHVHCRYVLFQEPLNVHNCTKGYKCIYCKEGNI